MPFPPCPISIRKNLGAVAFCLALFQASLGQVAPADKPAEATSTAPSANDVRKAESSFKRAIRLQANPENLENLTHALEALEESRELNPLEFTYATTYEFVKQQLISSYLEKGDRLLQQNRRLEAVREYRAAAELDSGNLLAKERLQSALSEPTQEMPARALSSSRDYASEPVLRPKIIKAAFDFKGDSRQLLTSIGKTFGITVLFDDSTSVRNVRFKIDEADFETVMLAARRVTGTFYVPMSETQMVVATDNLDTRRRLERYSLQSFALPNVSTQELQEIVSLLRTVLDIRFIQAGQASNTIIIRAPSESLQAAATLIEDLSYGRPEVLLEVNAYQLDRSMNRNIGVSLPLQFSLFNVATEARSLLNQSGSKELIDRLISGGLVSAADAAAIAALLAAQAGGVLTQPFAVFGGGKSLTGLTLPNATLKLDYSSTDASVIQKMTLRASQGQQAIFRIGDRIPVLTSQFAPLLNIPGVTKPNTTTVGQPIPSFNYEELGITLKATPRVSGSSEITIQLELQVKALGGQSFNNVPTISSREYLGTVTLKEGESSVLAGSINVQEQRSTRGLPFFSRIPIVGLAVSTQGKSESSSELLFVITPRIVRFPRTNQDATNVILDGN